MTTRLLASLHLQRQRLATTPLLGKKPIAGIRLVFRILLGALSDFPAGTSLNNSTVIGFGAIVNASNKVRIGQTTLTIQGQVDWSFPSDIRIRKISKIVI